MRSLRIALVVLAGLLIPIAHAGATSCYSTPPTFDGVNPPTVPQLNLLSSDIACNHTQVNGDGTITMDTRMFGIATNPTNSGATATDLSGYSFPLPSATATVDGQYFYLNGEFITAANGATKTVIIYVGATPATIYSAAGNAIRVKWEAQLVRQTATSSTLFVKTTFANNTGAMSNATVQYGAFATGNIWGTTTTIKLNAQGASTADVTATFMEIENMR
jgi:predicted RecA/RadA family phage recombinase